MAAHPVPEVITKLGATAKITDVILTEDYKTPFVYDETYDPIVDEVVMIKIFVDTSDVELWISIENTCCEDNWFGFSSDPKTTLVGKTITNIYQKPRDDPEIPFGKQECDEQWSVVINFSDGTRYKFHRNNSSNGYYSGKLRLNLYRDGKYVQ